MKVYIKMNHKIINLLQKTDLNKKKSEKLYIKKLLRNLKPCMKMDKKNYKD